MGARLMAGQQTLNLYVEVRLLCAQPVKPSDHSEGFLIADCLFIFVRQGLRDLLSGFFIILL